LGGERQGGRKRVSSSPSEGDIKKRRGGRYPLSIKARGEEERLAQNCRALTQWCRSITTMEKSVSEGNRKYNRGRAEGGWRNVNSLSGIEE